jgi:drug/metabolite transporter (DMT)-like permease
MIKTTTPQALAAAALVVAAMALLGLSDNLVSLVATEMGLWQFHATRSVIALILVIGVAQFYGVTLRPLRLSTVVLRSLLVSLSMVFYFGALAFVSVAQSAAGLFTAPIWVLLITFLVMGRGIALWTILAVALGFGGALLVLQPDVTALSPALVMPILAGILYALAALMTRAYCSGEHTLCLLAGFFVAILFWGVLGCAVLALWQPDVPQGAEGFLLRGWVQMSGGQFGLIAVQSVLAVVGVGLITKGYLLAEASFVSVFEYSLLIFGALWGWFLWSQTLGLWAVVGMGMIVVSGLVLARRGASA